MYTFHLQSEKLCAYACMRAQLPSFDWLSAQISNCGLVTIFHNSFFDELRTSWLSRRENSPKIKKSSALLTRSMNILDEILCIDEEEIDYEQDRVEELQYENLSDKGNSTPIKTEASLTTSYSPAPKPSSASSDGFLSFHKFLFSKPCQLFVVGGTNMFGKLEFLQCLEPVSYNGSTIDRPARTVLRPGDEVFVCSSRRTVACEKSLIIFGFFPWDRKNPDRGSVLVVNPGVVPRDASNVQTIFRVCPIKFVGLVPGGKHINEAGGLLREVEPLCRQLFNEFATSDQINPLSPLDLTTKPKSLFLPKTSTTNERSKRKQVPKGGAKPAPLKILPAKLKRISPTSSPVASTKSKVQKVEPIRTPPYAKRIENMLGTWYQQIRVGTSESSTLLSSPSCKLNFTR